MSGSEEQGAFARLVRQSAKWPLSVRILLLATAVLSAYPVLATLVAVQRGIPVWSAAALAAAICFTGASLAMALTAWLQGPQAAMLSLLMAMLFRMGLPLGLGLLLSRRYAELEAAGFFGLVLGFYLITLVAETLLVLPLIKTNSPAVKA